MLPKFGKKFIKCYGLIPTFVDITEEKLVVGAEGGELLAPSSSNPE